ncbi:hypothetical protein NGM37_17975, partial [Streptomyces sp. TRM76130]|nr:hypothetical protein [Streptomyces sp. TRM76130]
MRHLNPGTGPVLARLPDPQVGFNYLGRFTQGDSNGAGAWEPSAEAGPGGAADPEAPVLHLLDAGAVVRDTPAGPELTLSLAWPGTLIEDAER